MFPAFVEYYDLIYSTFKDYAAETAQITALLRRVHPGCRTVLDVACGTGEHTWRLAADGFIVDGLDIDPGFVRIASRKHPAGRFFAADMSDFHLPHRYDAVLCLFSSIGYLCTLDRIEKALTCFRDHLEPGGVIVVEPWLRPDVIQPNRTDTNSAEADGIRVSRHARLEVDGRVSRIFFDYEIDERGEKRRVSEVHELGLHTTEELMGAFRNAGLDADYDAKGLTNRGLFVARRPR